MKNNGTRGEKKMAILTRRRFPALGFSLIFLFSTAEIVFADDTKDKVFAERAKAAFNRAQIEFESHTNNPMTAWQFARACFDWADWATNKLQRATIASNGIASCLQSISLSNSAAAHYYLAMNLGQLAQADMLHGLRYVERMENEFRAADSLDAHFNFAGPSRGLGQLYREAPAWPVSIGSREKAREALEKAVVLAPDYPANFLTLAESYQVWDDVADAKKELESLDALWPAAQTNLTGQVWEQNWDDWSNRRDALRKALNYR